MLFNMEPFDSEDYYGDGISLFRISPVSEQFSIIGTKQPGKEDLIYWLFIGDNQWVWNFKSEDLFAWLSVLKKDQIEDNFFIVQSGWTLI